LQILQRLRSKVASRTSADDCYFVLRHEDSLINITHSHQQEFRFPR
jgi:hypothetical protein